MWISREMFIGKVRSCMIAGRRFHIGQYYDHEQRHRKAVIKAVAHWAEHHAPDECDALYVSVTRVDTEEEDPNFMGVCRVLCQTGTSDRAGRYGYEREHFMDVRYGADGSMLLCNDCSEDELG